MSRRGGGRRSDPREGQPSPAMSQPTQRGGGRGRGRGIERGRGASSPAPQHFPPMQSASSDHSHTSTIVSEPLSSSVTNPPAAFTSSGASNSAQRGGAGGGGRGRGRGGSEVSFPVSQPSQISQAPSSSGIHSSTASTGIEAEIGKLSLTPGASSKALIPPKRPGYGTIGRKVVLRANHFVVQVTHKDLFHYDITITPEITSKAVCRTIMGQLVGLYRESHLGGRYIAYDGGKSIYAAGELPFSSKEFIIKLTDKDSASSKRKERQFKVAIKYASKPDLHHLQQFLLGRQQDAPQETIQVLDVVLRSRPSSLYTVVGRSFFSMNLGGKGELGNGLEYWRGYYQSLRPVQMGLTLNIDVSARAFYESILVTDYIAKHFNIRNFNRPLADQDRLKIRRVLKAVKVSLTYRDQSRTYKITGISSEPVNKLMFTLGEKNIQISVAQYFREKYGVVLQFPSLPALRAGSDAKPIYLPMEVCKIVEGQRYTKKLNERQVTELLRATCQRPADRQDRIHKMVQHNNFGGDNIVNDFGIQVSHQLCEVDARVLPSPMLKYHDTGRESRVDPRMGQWNMIDKKMINGGRVDNWTCVNFSSRIDPGLPHEFCKQLVDMCNGKGMVFNRTPLLPIHSAHANQIESALANIHKQSEAKLVGEQGKRLQMLIIILPDVTGSYQKIKRLCETEYGIISQCCQPRQAQKLNKQYFENVALKINVKVGGRNNVLMDAFQRKIPLVTDRPTIIFGADVTHPSPGEDLSPSIAAVVASMDWPEVTKYRAIVSAQGHREEIIEDLYKKVQDPQRGWVHIGMIREHFMAYRRSTGMKPHRIIFYRDGVSEGQFSQVLLHEVDAIRKACASLEEGYQPPITFVVVQKRHHTRLFPTSRDTDRSGNILPGTVVDTKICHPTEFDFYLNSHAGIQGTSRPTHYHVLYDENNFTADGLQMLTNSLCYTYARCTRSVSIVPPAYYAHLAAFRARYYLDSDTSDSGSTGTDRSSTVSRVLPTVKENVKDVMFYC